MTQPQRVKSRATTKPTPALAFVLRRFTLTRTVFNPSGQRVSVWNGATKTQLRGQYYWGSKPVAFYVPSSATHFQHQDWLGTERLRTTYNGSVEATLQSLPFGDSQTTESGSDPYYFASLDYDSETGTDHAQFRQYSSTQGRWMRPDPYSGSYDFSNPQSLNRYDYVQDNPLSAVDPSGLLYCVPAGINARVPAGTSQYCSSPNVGDEGALNQQLDSLSAWWVPDWEDVAIVNLGEGPGVEGGTAQLLGYEWEDLGSWFYLDLAAPAPQNPAAPNNPKPPPLTPQQQHAQQQEILNRKCFAANAVSNTLWITSGLNALGAVGAGLSGVGAPLVPILGGISAVEAIGAGGYGLYASFVCYQATQ